MKRLLTQIFLAILILTNYSTSFSQNISDLGRKSYSDVKSMQKTDACEITIGKALTKKMFPIKFLLGYKKEVVLHT
jgi:phosphoribosylformimino-5-aminoimidazole carboxamide ribonucleotide (ProFAR) isomerase